MTVRSVPDKNVFSNCFIVCCFFVFNNRITRNIKNSDLNSYVLRFCHIPQGVNNNDLSDAVELDPQVIFVDLEKVNPHARVVLTNGKNGEGVEELIEALGI